MPIYHVRMMLLIGMNTSFITYPTTPMTANPRAQDCAIFKNSRKLANLRTGTFLGGSLALLEELLALDGEDVEVLDHLGHVGDLFVADDLLVVRHCVSVLVYYKDCDAVP